MVEDCEQVADRVPPADAFELVAHETRVAVLEALRRADGGPLSFGDIRAAVGVDDPGQCHYHVDRLVGQFVERADEGYSLSPSGWRLVGAVVSGGLTASLSEESVDADGVCSECGGALEASVRSAGVTVGCKDCSFIEADPDVPPAALAGRGESEIARTVGRWARRMETDAAHGFCPNCEGSVTRTVAAPADDAAPGWFDGDAVEAVVVTDCDHCGYWWHSMVPIAALVEPAVVAFHHEHGIDLRERPWWTLESVEIGAAELTADPRRVRVPMEIDDDARTFVFGDEFGFVREREA
ncbi:MAG: DUF7351 domain-containing protein [Halolamina sp.]